MKVELRPQKGPQEQFLASPADIAIYGGGAGGGKTWGLLLEPLRHITTNPLFNAVYFRRTTVQIRNPGGLWDASTAVYPQTGGKPQGQALSWRWPGGGLLKMAHLEHEDDKLGWQGSEITLLNFDELTHFTETQFWYVLSRTRSMSGVLPYVRATCNPDPDSWVAKFIAWWIDQKTGLFIPERVGVLRYVVRVNDTLEWGDSKEELAAKFPGVTPKSVTFIPALVTDNPALLAKDPSYIATLQLLPRVERERLLGGNWKVRPSDSLMFARDSVKLIPTVPDDIVAWARGWDLAATKPSEKNPDPDATATVLVGRRRSGGIVVVPGIWMRDEAKEVRKVIVETTKRDKMSMIPVYSVLPIDPGQAGKSQFQSMLTMLQGFRVEGIRETGSKDVRAEPFSAFWQNSLVEVVENPWTDRYLNEMESFPGGAHDDYVDASAKAFDKVTASMSLQERFAALAS